jgi:hypothetical protein
MIHGYKNKSNQIKSNHKKQKQKKMSPLLSTFPKAEEGSYRFKCGHTVEMNNSTTCNENHISGDKKITL